MWLTTLLGLLLVLTFAAFVAYLLSPDVEECVHDWLEGARGWMGQVRVDHISHPSVTDPHACDQLELTTGVRPRQAVLRARAARLHRLRGEWRHRHPDERMHPDPCDAYCVRVLRERDGQPYCLTLCA
jgi:hypothetical protein